MRLPIQTNADKDQRKCAARAAVGRYVGHLLTQFQSFSERGVRAFVNTSVRLCFRECRGCRARLNCLMSIPIPLMTSRLRKLRGNAGLKNVGL